MTWNEYIVHFDTERGPIKRYIRATSSNDARWRVVRKFILPLSAVITNVEKCS